MAGLDYDLSKKWPGQRGFRPGGGEAPPAAQPQPQATGGNDSVWQPGSGFRNTGAFRERAQQAEQLKAGAAQVGEPTSFRGGAGAPEPIAVMRGTATTFSPGRLPGQQFAQPEMATPLQAQQAWNQGTEGPGGFRAPGTSLAEAGARAVGEQQRLTQAAENKRPDLVAAADIATQKQKDVVRTKAGTDFDQLMHESPYSTFDTGKGKTEFKAKDESQYRDYLASKNIALAQGDPAAGRQHFEERQMVRQWLQTQKNKPDFNADAALDAANKNPEHWQGLVADAKRVLGVSQPAPKRSFWGNLMGPTQLQGEAGALPPVAAAAPPIRPTQPPAGFRGLVESME